MDIYVKIAISTIINWIKCRVSFLDNDRIAGRPINTQDDKRRSPIKTALDARDMHNSNPQLRPDVIKWDLGHEELQRSGSGTAAGVTSKAVNRHMMTVWHAECKRMIIISGRTLL